jgi:anti-anti-sigma factor
MVGFTVVGDVVVLKPDGELKSRGGLARIIWSHLHKGRNKFIVNFENVRSVNSVGLNALVEFKRLAEASGGSLTLCKVHADLLKVFHATNMFEVFSIVDDEDMALAGTVKGLPHLSAASSISRYRN